MKHLDAYFKSAFTVDNVIFGFDESDLKVLLIKRIEEPFIDHWALPGYFVKPDEDLNTAARRVLKELAGIENVYLEQVKTFGAVDRHPAGRVITIAYYSLVKIANFTPRPDRSIAGEVQWFSISKLHQLAFDHREIIDECFQRLKRQVRVRPIGFELLPRKFTLTELQHLYEAILETELEKRNFRKKILSMNLLIDLNEMQEGVAHRPAKLYQFDRERYEELLQDGFNFEVKESKRKEKPAFV
ncbi:MAG: NUDIX domain-containing protein [Bacteroidetes bacterium]|nr:MAG: NUDIX domain-containing protein [Bacteroidota bacterium]